MREKWGKTLMSKENRQYLEKMQENKRENVYEREYSIKREIKKQ